jgi:DNA-binding transcriptional LysR family regulator
MLNLNDARIFVKVVEHGGFSQAARALGVPKSTLSKRVGELERELDVALIRRTSRRFVVTPIGRDLHTQARAIVELAESAEATVRGHRAVPAGPVSMTCSVPAAQTWLAELLPLVARRHPQIQLTVHATDRFVDLLRDGFDLAVRDHFAPLADSSLVQQKLFVEPIILVASPAYLRRKPLRQPHDLAAHDALVTGAAQGEWSLSRTIAGEAPERVTVRVRARFAADETAVLLSAARSGLGVAPLPAPACERDLKEGKLRRVLPEWTAGQVTTTLLLVERRSRLPSVRAISEAIITAARGSARQI